MNIQQNLTRKEDYTTKEYLLPEYTTQKSFYNKTHIIWSEDEKTGDILINLYSYNTYILSYNTINNKIIYITGFYSNTTTKHIKEFLKQYTNYNMSLNYKEIKKEIEKDVKEYIDYIEDSSEFLEDKKESIFYNFRYNFYKKQKKEPFNYSNKILEELQELLQNINYLEKFLEIEQDFIYKDVTINYKDLNYIYNYLLTIN